MNFNNMMEKVGIKKSTPDTTIKAKPEEMTVEEQKQVNTLIDNEIDASARIIEIYKEKGVDNLNPEDKENFSKTVNILRKIVGILTIAGGVLLAGYEFSQRRAGEANFLIGLAMTFGGTFITPSSKVSLTPGFNR